MKDPLWNQYCKTIPEMNTKREEYSEQDIQEMYKSTYSYAAYETAYHRKMLRKAIIIELHKARRRVCDILSKWRINK